jgi:hypothetical protein
MAKLLTFHIFESILVTLLKQTAEKKSKKAVTTVLT